MKQDLTPFIWISLPLGLVGVLIGFLAGINMRTPTPMVVQAGGSAPVNYDPARAICSDALKAAQASEHQCWDHLQDVLIQQRGNK